MLKSGPAPQEPGRSLVYWDQLPRSDPRSAPTDYDG
jgi:hypothetical protein